MTVAHRHEWTALWFHFGPYRRQDVHVHGCFDGRCKWFLIGEGRQCNEASNHWVSR